MHYYSVNKPRTPRRALNGKRGSQGTGPQKGGRAPHRDAHTPKAIGWVQKSLILWGKRKLNYQRMKHLSEHMALGFAKMQGQCITLLLLLLLISA